MMKAYFDVNKQLIDNVRVTMNAINECDPHYHNDVEILYIVSGEQRVQINNEARLIKENELAIIDCYEIHSFSGGAVSSNIVIPPNYLNDYFLHKGNNNLKEHFVSKKKTTDECIRYISHISKAKNKLEIKGYVNLLLSEVIGAVSLGKRDSGKQDSLLIKRVLEYIETNYPQQISLDVISKHFNYTSTHFSHIFNSFFNCNINEYVNMVRIRKFLELKNKKPGSGFSSLAFDVGFMSLPTFYRAFNKAYGVPPKKYFEKNEI